MKVVWFEGRVVRIMDSLKFSYLVGLKIGWCEGWTVLKVGMYEGLVV